IEGRGGFLPGCFEVRPGPPHTGGLTPRRSPTTRNGTTSPGSRMRDRQTLDPSQKISTLRLGARIGQRLAVTGRRLVTAPQTAKKIGPHGRQEIVVLHGRLRAQLVERRQ